MDGDSRRFNITNLSNEDNVGVLTQNRLQPSSKGEPSLLIGLNLIDRRENVFNGVLDRHDISSNIADLIERRIQRGRLA